MNDVVVYGGTPSGVAASVAAARRGMKVVLVAAGGTVGGMMSNGLSASDIGSRAPIRGVALEVFNRIDGIYDGKSDWRVEPHVAELVFRQMLSEEGVEVHLNCPVVAVERNQDKLCALRTAGDIIYGRSFIDASYPGDLFSFAGCPFQLGMTDLVEYNEPLARKRSIREVQKLGISEAEVTANPFIKVQKRKDLRDGMPSITYRLCLEKGESAVEIKPAPNYKDQCKYFRALLAGYMERDSLRAERVDFKSNGTLHSAYYQLAKIPGQKYDLNSGWASFTNVTTNKQYFLEVSARENYHRKVAALVRNFFYFVQVDSSVPEDIRIPFADFGLARNEFQDNDFWPYEPYLREGRRVVGRYVLTERDIFLNRRKLGGVAVGSYPVDSKLTQLLFWRGALYRDIGPHVRVPQYEIPYWCMLPAQGIKNLLVSIGISASPVAFGSVRLEPQFLALGEAAGVASAVSLTSGVNVYDLSPIKLQEELVESKSLKRVELDGN